MSAYRAGLDTSMFKMYQTDRGQISAVLYCEILQSCLGFIQHLIIASYIMYPHGNAIEIYIILILNIYIGLFCFFGQWPHWPGWMVFDLFWHCKLCEARWWQTDSTHDSVGWLDQVHRWWKHLLLFKSNQLESLANGVSRVSWQRCKSFTWI